MELNLQPHAPSSGATSRPFAEGDKVVSYLVRAIPGEFARHDVLAAEDAEFRPEGTVLCRWVHSYRPKPREDNPERMLKLTAENLFVTLADPANEPAPANTPLLQFLALLLERKRLLRPRGRTVDGERNLFEHVRTHQMYEIPVGDLSPEFFAKIQEQLGVLVGGAKVKPSPPPPA
ncbi:MAG TPA: hypothetical protein VLW52_14905 [Opitutaceae bacterium]|nr:hypothetical protein [Opitutaceae bacterium]HUJ44886.1 hypothetical protein [Opitutaceae bacterium]